MKLNSNDVLFVVTINDVILYNVLVDPRSDELKQLLNKLEWCEEDCGSDIFDIYVVNIDKYHNAFLYYALENINSDGRYGILNYLFTKMCLYGDARYFYKHCNTCVNYCSDDDADKTYEEIIDHMLI